MLGQPAANLMSFMRVGHGVSKQGVHSPVSVLAGNVPYCRWLPQQTQGQKAIFLHLPMRLSGQPQHRQSGDGVAAANLLRRDKGQGIQQRRQPIRVQTTCAKKEEDRQL